MKMDQKWELVRAELVSQPTFQKWTDVTAQNLRQQFNRFKEEVNANADSTEKEPICRDLTRLPVTVTDDWDYRGVG